MAFRNQGERSVSFLNNCKSNTNPFESSVNNLLTEFSYNEDIHNNPELQSKKSTLVISYEDEFIEDVLDEGNIKSVRDAIGESENLFKLVILRDPLNFFASRLKSEQKKATIPPKLKVYLRKFYFKLGDEMGFSKYFFQSNNRRWTSVFDRIRMRLSDNTFCKIPLYDSYHGKLLVKMYKEYCYHFMKDEKIIPINFNLWYFSKNYRDKISSKLQFENKEIGLEETALMSNFGGIINPDERWYEFADDEFYKSLFRDHELMHYEKTIFSETTNQKAEKFISEINGYV